MQRRTDLLPRCLLALVCCVIPCSTATAQESPGRVLRVLRDYDAERPGLRSPMQFHNWPEVLKQRAAEFSTVEVVSADKRSGQACRIRIAEDFPWRGRDSYRAAVIGPDYLPPEADAVRMRVKVNSGTVRLSVGSPTVYFGHSDVQSATRTLQAADPPRWETIEFSLHHHLSRNYRRARFGRASPVIHYTRWIQEPLYLYVTRPSAGVCMVDQVELITRGEGREFPSFSADNVRHIATAADFEAEALSQAFTFFQEPVDFARPPYLVRENWRPPRLSLVDTSPEGGRSLQIEHQASEEVSFTGIHLPRTQGANALALKLQCEHGTERDQVVLDFVVYVAVPRDDRFPWEQFAPPIAWRKHRDVAFDYYLSQSRLQRTSYAFYHTRRTVPVGERRILVLPFADFACAFGQGNCEPLFLRQQPLPAAQTIALGVVPPYGMRHGLTRILIDDVSLVHVPGTAEELRSYPQPAAAADE